MKTPPEVGDHEVNRSRLVERTPVYYGWVILLAGTFGLFMTTPGQTVGVSVFLDSIIVDLGLSRSTVSLLYTFATLAGSLALPFVGRFVDTKGPRRAVIVIAILFALACVWMGFIRGIVSLFVGFMLIRSLGQGSLSLVSLHVINLWFIQRRGLAVGPLRNGFCPVICAIPPFYRPAHHFIRLAQRLRHPRWLGSGHSAACRRTLFPWPSRAIRPHP